MSVCVCEGADKTTKGSPASSSSAPSVPQRRAVPRHPLRPAEGSAPAPPKKYIIIKNKIIKNPEQTKSPTKQNEQTKKKTSRGNKHLAALAQKSRFLRGLPERIAPLVSAVR